MSGPATDKKRLGKCRSVNVPLPRGAKAAADELAREEYRSLTKWVVLACRRALAGDSLPDPGDRNDETLYIDLPTDLLSAVESALGGGRFAGVTTLTEFVRRAVVAGLA
jgi:hypothetical protein